MAVKMSSNSLALATLEPMSSTAGVTAVAAFSFYRPLIRIK